MQIRNEELKNHQFLKKMYDDAFYPNMDVDRGKEILINLCLEIEAKKPTILEALYKLTHKATNQFNELDEMVNFKLKQ